MLMVTRKRRFVVMGRRELPDFETTPSDAYGQDEILSGTESNLARHGRRMAGEFFRMLTF